MSNIEIKYIPIEVLEDQITYRIDHYKKINNYMVTEYYKYCDGEDRTFSNIPTEIEDDEYFKRIFLFLKWHKVGEGDEETVSLRAVMVSKYRTIALLGYSAEAGIAYIGQISNNPFRTNGDQLWITKMSLVDLIEITLKSGTNSIIEKDVIEEIMSEISDKAWYKEYQRLADYQNQMSLMGYCFNTSVIRVFPKFKIRDYINKSLNTLFGTSRPSACGGLVEARLIGGDKANILGLDIPSGDAVLLDFTDACHITLCISELKELCNYKGRVLILVANKNTNMSDLNSLIKVLLDKSDSTLVVVFRDIDKYKKVVDIAALEVNTVVEHNSLVPIIKSLEKNIKYGQCVFNLYNMLITDDKGRSLLANIWFRGSSTSCRMLVEPSSNESIYFNSFTIPIEVNNGIDRLECTPEEDYILDAEKAHQDLIEAIKHEIDKYLA